MTYKKYLNISEVSKLLQIEEHKIRYWDSPDPKTNKFRVEGISTKSKGGTRYFNKENIKKLQKLKNILYDGNSHNHSIKLAEKILSSDNKFPLHNNNNLNNSINPYNDKKISQILNKMRILLKKDNIK
tara:strand:- start:73 stop:456 length:384 start_codon:yes stop_codon:yes gene_type:complete